MESSRFEELEAKVAQQEKEMEIMKEINYAQMVCFTNLFGMFFERVGDQEFGDDCAAEIDKLTNNLIKISEKR